LDVIVTRTVVATGAATVAGLSDPSALAVKVAGRTAVAAPFEGEGGGVVALAWPDVVCAGAPAVLAAPDRELEADDPDPQPASGRNEARTPRIKAVRRLIDPRSAADKRSSEA
jgi:hypothetical protein